MNQQRGTSAPVIGYLSPAWPIIDIWQLFQPEDVDDLCARISAILDDPNLARRLAEAARQTYEEQYDPVSVAAETLDLYRSLPGCAQLAGKA